LAGGCGSGGTAIPSELANSFQLLAGGAACGFAGGAAGFDRGGAPGGGEIGRGGSAAGCAPSSVAKKFQWSSGFGSVMMGPNVEKAGVTQYPSIAGCLQLL
jgi:hypothetical protein